MRIHKECIATPLQVGLDDHVFTDGRSSMADALKDLKDKLSFLVIVCDRHSAAPDPGSPQGSLGLDDSFLSY